MIRKMNRLHRLLLGAFVLYCTLATPLSVWARSDDSDSSVYDARVQGYATPVQLDSGSTALTWLLLIVLAAIAIGVLFKDAKRSHLD